MMMTSSPPSNILDGWIADRVHHYLIRVQYEDTDLGGIVYHANYLKFAERARSSYLRLLGILQEEAILPGGGGAGFVVRRAEIDFQEPAGLGAVVCVTSQVTALSRVRVKMVQKVKNNETGHILAGVFVEIVYAGVDGQGMVRPRRMPPEMMARLQVGEMPGWV